MAKHIKGYEEFYSIDENGSLINLIKNKPVKIHLNKAGYQVVNLSGKNGLKQHYVHRLVAEAFIPNPDQRNTVNHKNGIKTDNRIDNLEWNSLKENLQHAFKTGLKNNKHSQINILDTKTGISYNGIKEAATAIGISYSHLSKMICGERQNTTTLIRQ